MKISLWRFLPLVLFLLLGFFLWRGLSLDPQALPSAKLGKALPQFSLPELGKPENRLTTDMLKGRVVLLNVWASWCSACVEEQVFMLGLARQGVIIYGLNYKDRSEDAKKWLQDWGNPYQLIAQDLQGKLAIDLGVYGAPETFLIDKAGRIRYRHAGILNEAVWKRELLPLMRLVEREG